MPVSFTYTADTYIDDAKLDFAVNSPQGPVGDTLHKRGTLAVFAARAQVGVDTGALRASIGMIHDRVGAFQTVTIYANDPIAYYHHEGTAPHVILPQRHQQLRFSGGGRVIYTHHVNHPGTRPNRFLEDQLTIFKR